jgi:hypothetical protein
VGPGEAKVGPGEVVVVVVVVQLLLLLLRLSGLRLNPMWFQPSRKCALLRVL